MRQKAVGIQNRAVLNCIAFNVLNGSKGSQFKRLGSDYGGWHVTTECLTSKGEKLLISAGLGHDVTFDLAMLEHDFKVIGLDPLKSSFEYASGKLAVYQDKVELINAGMWNESGSKMFYSPKVTNHDSWSISNVQETGEALGEKFEVVDLAYLANHSFLFKNNDVRILKMDIEGAELALFPMIANFEPKFQQVSIEMDFVSLIKFKQLARRIRAVNQARRAIKLMAVGGYELRHIEHFNFTWVLNHP
jgi:FkbM family methyltransferase